MFPPFCFLCWLCFWYVFLLFLLCFLLVLVLLSQTMKNCFPSNSSVFSHVGYKVVFLVSCFGYCLFSCVVCCHFRQLICNVLCLCCLVSLLFKTGLSGFVVCSLWSSFIFVVLS